MKRLCSERGIPPWERERLPVLRAGKTPIAVPGVGMDAAFAPHPGGTAVYASFYRNRKTEEDGHDEK